MLFLECKWTLILIISALCNIIVGANERKVICYLDNNSLDPNNYLQFNLDKIDINLCTHLIYSFATIKEDALIPSNKTLDIDLGGYLNVTKLKVENPQLKTIISIKEQQDEFSKFSILLTNIRARRNFIKNILNFLKEFNFDGIDIIWEQPASDKSHKCDKKNYEKFVKELRRLFTEDSRRRKLDSFSISIGIPYNINDAIKGYDIPKLNRYVDWFNLMSYDSKELFSIQNNKTENGSPINYYLNAGAPRDKVILGISTYGLLFNIESSSEINNTNAEILQDPLKILELTGNANILSYSDICKNIKNNSEWKLYRGRFGSFTRNFAINGNKIILFKDVTILREKVECVVDRNLGGLSFYTINQDDFNGLCIEEPYPLISTANKILLQKLNLRNSRSANARNGEDTINSTILQTRADNDQNSGINSTNLQARDDNGQDTTNGTFLQTRADGLSRDRIVCYTTSWSIYRTGPARFDLSQFDPNLCTHLIYAYARVVNETVQYADENSDITLGGYAKFLRLRSLNDNLKLLIGLRVIDKEFPQVIANSERRKIFIDNTMRHLKMHMFDGLDIVWKYPGIEDKKNFVILLEELRARFAEEMKASGRTRPYLVSITIPSEIEFIDPGYDIPKLNSLVDWYNLLSYDYHIPSESAVNHHAPLYPLDTVPDDKMNVNATVNYYLNSGIDRTQLVVGIPTYGISFILKDSANSNFGAEVEGPGTPGKYTNISGAISYFEICGAQSTSNWETHRPYPGRVGPYIVNGKDWIAYDDEIMMKSKAEYVADMGLGGLMFWTVDHDDFRGICGGGPNILIQMAKFALLNKLNLGSPNIISTTTTTIEMKPVTALDPTEETAQIITTTTNIPLISASISKDRNEENSPINDRIVCYTTNWSVYRTGAGRFTQNLIDPNLCTHIIYAYGKITENNTLESSDPNSDITLGGYAQLNSLKKLNSNLRTLIGIRDFSKNNSLFPAVVSSSESRQQFIESIINFLKENDFDGIDIVWKNTKLSERNNFVKFIEEISERFGKESRIDFQQTFLLTIALPGKRSETQGFDIANLNKYVDWFNVLTYNYHAASEPQANHAAALYPLPEQPFDEFNANFTIDQYLGAGAERSKLVITIPTYGRTFTLANISQTNYGSPSVSGGNEGELTKNKGSLAYFEICNFLLNDVGWETFQPYPTFVGPVVIKGDQWVSYDDEMMMRTKADYVADNGFGGLAFWSVDQDDFRGICDGNTFTLIKAAKNRLDEKLGFSSDVILARRSTTTTAGTPIPTEFTVTKTTTLTSVTTTTVAPSTSDLTTPTTAATTISTTSTTTSPTTIKATESSISTVIQGSLASEDNTNNRIVCYSTNWSFYRSGTARFVPNERNLNPSLCTHLNYFFAKIENDTVIPLDNNVDIANGGYSMFTELKTKNNNLKTLISISEQQSNETLSRFSLIAANPNRRSSFAQNVLNFIKQYNFDGIDIVWMHPGDARGTPNDKTNLISLIEELRTTFDADILFAGRLPYIITMAVPFDPEIINTGYDIPRLNENLDWFNLLTYDYTRSTEPLVNHHAPLYPYEGITSMEKNIDFTVMKYIELGAERNKIVIGIPTYGRSFTLADASRTNYGSPASGVGIPGSFTQLNDSLAYYEICQNINNEGWVVVQNQSGLVGPYAYNERNWVAYDDENMVSSKAEYVALTGLGGMMFWTIDQDDFVGSCTGQANLLISTAKEVLNQRLSIGNERLTTRQTIITSSSNNNIEVSSTTVSTIQSNIMSSPPITRDEMIDSVVVDNGNFEDRRDRIVCYTPNWSRYRASVAKFDASFILPDLCTHLMYAFANLDNDTVSPSDAYADIDQKGYENFNRIKSKNSQLATLISINQRENFTQYVDLVNDPQRRQIFIENLLNFLKMHNFNGVDIDWQYPGENSNDKENFVQFLREINLKFEEDAEITKSPRFLLTITIPSEKRLLDRGYDILQINDLVDWFNLLSYNYHKPTEPLVNHHAPLYALKGIDDSENNVNASVLNYIAAGIERSKLVVGIPTYGVTFTLADTNETGIHSPAIGPGIKGDLSGNEGSLAFYEICQKLYNDPESEWTIVQDKSRAIGPYAYKGTRWLAFDDEESVRRKAEYVADRGLGGLMFWSLDQDDFRGICGDREPNALIQTGKRALLQKLSISVTPSTSFIPDSFTPSSLPSSPDFVPPSSITSPASVDDFTCLKVGLFPNPKDCKTYYACIDLYELGLGIISQLLDCPGNGGYFDNKKGDCMFLDDEDSCREQNKYDHVVTSPATTSQTQSSESIIIPMTPTPPRSPDVPSSENNSTISRLLQLINVSGGLEKFEQFIKSFSSNIADSTTLQTIISSPNDISSVSEPTVITADNNKKYTLRTQIQVGSSSTDGVVQSQFEIPNQGSNNANELSPQADHIYQIKELHIHNYGQPILDERDISGSLRQTINHNKQDQPVFVLAPVQVINKVHS